MARRSRRRTRALRWRHDDPVPRLAGRDAFQEQRGLARDRPAQLQPGSHVAPSGARVRHDGVHGDGRRPHRSEGTPQPACDDDQVRGRARGRASPPVHLHAHALRHHRQRRRSRRRACDRTVADEVLLGVEHAQGRCGAQDNV